MTKRQSRFATPRLLIGTLVCLLLSLDAAAADQEPSATPPATQMAEEAAPIHPPAKQPAKEAPDDPATRQPATQPATDEEAKATAPVPDPEAKPSPAKPTRPPRRVLFNTYLYSLDHPVSAYGRAKTSVERDEAVAKARNAAGEGLEGVLLIIDREVVDIRMPKDGIAEIIVGGSRNNHYVKRKDAPVSVIFVFPIKVRMTAEQAKQVRKGDTLTMAAEPRWSSAGSQAVAWGSNSQHVAQLMIRNTPASLGTIRATKYTCTIRGMTLQSPYELEPPAARQ